MTDRLTGHSKVSQWSKVNLFWLQIGRYIQHAQLKFLKELYKHCGYLSDKLFFIQPERLYLRVGGMLWFMHSFKKAPKVLTHGMYVRDVVISFR